MQPFGYARATAPEEAAQAIARNPAIVFIAGGTSLLDLVKLGVEHPEMVLDLNALPQRHITVEATGVRLGALARNSEVAAHPVIQERYPVLSQALLSGASPQLRNMATVGGNVMQRTRCAYFRDPTFGCNKRAPGSGCSALDGCHRGHAILGTSQACIATHPSDMAVALTALEASVELLGPRGIRTVPIESFYRLPGKTPHLETVLQPGELITAVTLPERPFTRRSTYLKVRDRADFDFALASVALAVELQGGLLRQVRIALGGIATKPWRAHEAERLLVGQGPSRPLFERAAAAELAAAQPRGENAFKETLAQHTIVRALEALTKEGGQPA